MSMDRIRSLLACLVAAWLLSATIGAPAALAHDFGGPTQPGDEDDDDEDPPCDSGDECCDGDQGGGGDPPPEPGGRTESPISYYDGSESLLIGDMVIRGAFPIYVTRKYDSRSTYDTPLGYGWAFLHDRRLFEYPDGSVVIRRGCGTRDRYIFSGGAYVSPAGGTLSTLTEQPDGSFVVNYRNGFTDYFDSQGRLTAHRDRQGNRHEYTYDARGKLPLTGASKQAVDVNQPMTVAHVYRLLRIDERSYDGTLTGRYVTFDYSESTGRLTTATADDGRTVTYEHDVTAGLTKGNLVEVNGLEGIVASYGYEDARDNHNLTSIVAAAGRTPVVNTYDDQDRVTRQDEGTRRIEFNYQIPYSRTVVTRTIRDANGLNPVSAISTYEFDASGRILKIIDALGHERRYSYTPAKRLSRSELWQKTGSTLALLQARDWTYDTAGRRLTESVTLESGETVTRSWTYNQDWIASEQVISSVAPAKVFRTEYTFNLGPDGRPVSVQSEKRRKDDGTFQVTTYSYDSRNRLESTTLPDGMQIVHEYTGDRLTRVYNRIGASGIPQGERRFGYDAAGNRNQEWDARDNLTTYEHDDLGRIVSITNPLGEQTLYSYTMDRITQIERGRTVSDGEGQITRLGYDARGRLTGVQRKNDSGAFVTFEAFQLDSEGRRTARTDALNATTLMTYDLLGRIRTITDPEGEQIEHQYDAAGNRILHIDSNQQQTRYEYDALNRLTAIVELGVVPNVRTQYVYDAADNVVRVTNGENRTTIYGFDALSRHTRTTQPLGQFVQYTYDDRDRIDTFINARGQKVDFDYTNWGPLAQERHFPTAAASTPTRTISYTHDDVGNVLSVTDNAIRAGAAFELTYDALNRAFDETVKYVPGGDRVLQHRYDRFGNRREVTLQGPANTFTHTYGYNALNQLATANLAGWPITIESFADDRRHSVALPNDVTEEFTYWGNGTARAIDITGPSGALSQIDLTYAGMRNVATRVDEHGTHQFGYDGLNRLTQALRPSGAGLPNESYSYDRAGNREDPGNAAAYNYDDNNRITASPGRTYGHDDDGNLQSRSDGASFVFDVENRLLQFSRGATTASYLYAPDGRRVRKTVGGVDTWFVWDGPRLLAEFNAGGTLTRRYGYLGTDHIPTDMEDASGHYALHPDFLQQTLFATNDSGVVVWRARYESFGATTVEGDPDGDGTQLSINLRFAGQYFDAESGLHYNLLRYYDPTLGRYISADPLGLEVGPNLYLYVNARPTVGIDPFGLQGSVNARFPINQYNRNVRQPYNSRYNNNTPPPPRNTPRPERLPPPEWYQRNDQQRRDFNDRLADELDQMGDRISDVVERKKLKDKARELRENPPPPPPPPPMVCRIGDRPDGGPYMSAN